MVTNLLEALLDLHKNSRSGVLRIERKLEKKQLVLSKGLLAFAESNMPEEHLVRIMVKLGILPKDKVSEIASLMKTGKTSEEAIFALSGLEAQDLEKARHEQAVAILASLLSWDGCTLHFYQGEDLVRYQTNLSFSLLQLLVLSARRAAANHLIPAPPGFLQETYCIAKDFAAKALDFPLNNLESYVLSQLTEPIRVNDLLSIIPHSDAKPEELLLSLSALGLIERYSPPDSAAAPEPNPLVQSIEDMQARFENASLYEILSIPANAGPEDIQAAYHGLARQYHPDRFQSQEFSSEIRSKVQQVFTFINEAYITLKHPASRAVYDENRLSKESKVETELKTRSTGRSEDDKTAEALFNDGRALLANGDFEKAIERLNGCVFLRPEKAIYHHYLGVAQAGMPKLRKSAEQHLLKALELDSTSVSSRLELAKIYTEVGLRRKAELHLQQILHWDPENQEALNLIAELEKLDDGKTGSRLKLPFSRT
jgi:curved DNA-binding protein CbpA